MNVIEEREAEAAERKLNTTGSKLRIGRNERKLRRRDKAAILKPKPPPEEKEELNQEWWDNYRAQKQAPPSENRGMEVENAHMIMEKKENRRIQSRIPRAKGRGGRGGVPGIEIIEAYKPMTTALGPRMTVSSCSSSPEFLFQSPFPSCTSPRAVFWESGHWHLNGELMSR